MNLAPLSDKNISLCGAKFHVLLIILYVIIMEVKLKMNELAQNVSIT